MLENLIESVVSAIVSFIENTGYLGIFAAMVIESALIPLPSEITMPFAGFLVSLGKLNFWLVVTAGAVGNLVGSLIAYAIGFYLAEHIIENLIEKYGKFILLTKSDYLRAKSALQEWGDFVVFGSRLLPAIRTVISLPCGLAQLPLLKFAILTFTGSFIWSALLTYFGLVLGENWQILRPIFEKFDFVIVGGVIFLISIYVFRKISEKD